MPNTEDERYQQLQLEEAEELKKRRQEAINYILTYVNKARVEAEVKRLKELFAPLDTGRPAEKKTDRKKKAQLKDWRKPGAQALQSQRKRLKPAGSDNRLRTGRRQHQYR